MQWHSFCGSSITTAYEEKEVIIVWKGAEITTDAVGVARSQIDSLFTIDFSSIFSVTGSRQSVSFWYSKQEAPVAKMSCKKLRQQLRSGK